MAKQTRAQRMIEKRSVYSMAEAILRVAKAKPILLPELGLPGMYEIDEETMRLIRYLAAGAKK